MKWEPSVACSVSPIEASWGSSWALETSVTHNGDGESGNSTSIWIFSFHVQFLPR